MTSTIVTGRNPVSDHISTQRDKHLSVKVAIIVSRTALLPPSLHSHRQPELIEWCDENPGKQLSAPLPQKTPRKVLGDITNSSSTQKARKPPVLGTPKPGLLPTQDSTSKRKERGRGGGVASARKGGPQQSANAVLSELEHMAPPELDKPDVFTVPSYIKALRSFRPTLPLGVRGGACDATFDDCPQEPTRPRDRDEYLFTADRGAPPISPAQLPDLAELDMLLNNL